MADQLKNAAEGVIKGAGGGVLPMLEKGNNAENAVKGDTTSSITKDAQLETGITIKVPAFIKQDDLISVDTATGAYRERVKE